MTVEASKICGAVVAVALGASPVAADVSSFCTKPAAGPATLGFDVRPSMVVNAPAVLDVTRGDLGLGGTAGERAFSFSRTVAAISSICWAWPASDCSTSSPAASWV